MNVWNWRPWPYTTGSVAPGTWLCTVVRYAKGQKSKRLETLRLTPDGTWVRPGTVPLRPDEAVRAFTWVDQDWVPDSVIEEGERNAKALRAKQAHQAKIAAWEKSVPPKYSPWFSSKTSVPWEPGVYQVASVCNQTGRVLTRIKYRHFRVDESGTPRWSQSARDAASACQGVYLATDSFAEFSWRGLAKPLT